jgi:hypothetical protein
VSPQATDGLPPNSTTLEPDDSREAETKERITARKLILLLLLGGYVVLLSVNIAVPFLVKPTPAEVTQIRDLMLAISSALQGLVGLVAVAVGFYFRAAQEK